MGLCNSKPSYIASTSGGEREYQERFLESKTLGAGEFGVVKLVHDVRNKDLVGAEPLAVKYLRKGFTFRDNTLYTPLKKKVLKGEVEILRALNGECYNLKLVAVYETPSMIYMVTEYCEGGEMMPWVSESFKDTSGLRTEDVSRICYQLWSAVDHCAKHKVIHRDIKPQNVMFRTKGKDAELRLIDFGSGTIPGLEDENEEDDIDRHHTFAGSAFYISPEMFQRTYTSKTDVWSAAATLYVLVAGYPADKLQETFDILQGKEKDRLRKLPNLPDNMPDSFYEMLEGGLQFRHKSRKDAGELMKCEFSQFHIHHRKTDQGGSPGTISIHDIAAEAAGEYPDDIPEMAQANLSGSNAPGRTKSVLLEGSVHRHNAYLGYQKFERSVTTVLATMLSKDTCQKLIELLGEQHQNVEDEDLNKSHSSTEKKEEDPSVAIEVDAAKGIMITKANAEKLQVVTIKVLLEVLGGMEVENFGEVKDVMLMIQAQKNFNLYQSYAYHISLLRQFVSIQTRSKISDKDAGDNCKEASSVHGSNVWNSLKKKRGIDFSGHGKDKDSSVRSATSFQSTGRIKRISTATRAISTMA